MVDLGHVPLCQKHPARKNDTNTLIVRNEMDNTILGFHYKLQVL